MRLAALSSIFWLGCSFSGGSALGNDPADSGPSVDALSIDADMCRSDWFDCAYRARQKITVDNSGGAALDGVPVAIRFDGTDPRFGTFGDQLRFRNGTDDADLPFEIEDMGANAIVWVRVDLPESDIASLSMYYDNPANSVASNGADTFGGFAGVYHLSDTFGAGDPVNSSTEQNNLVPTNLSVGDQVATPLGLGLEVGAGVTEYLETPNATTDFIVGDNQALSYEAWFRTPSDTATRVIFDNRNDLCQGIALFISSGVDGLDGGLVALFAAGNNCQGGSVDTFVAGTAMVDDDMWHHAVFLVDRSAQTIELLVDGVSDATDSGILQTGSTGNRATRFGSRNDGLASFGGILDEIRIGPIRDLAWYEATYANGISGSQMVTVMPEELVESE